MQIIRMHTLKIFNMAQAMCFIVFQLLLIVCYLMDMHAPISFFLHAAVIPIPKNTKLNLSTTCNYRAIALSSMFSKILDKISMSLQCFNDFRIVIRLQRTFFYYNVLHFTC